MKNGKKILINTGVLLAGLLLAAPVFAQDAREIMRQAFNLEDGETQISRTRISTCRYVTRNKKLACAEKPRVKVMESVRKDYGPNGKDVRSIMILLDPPGERGIGLLQYDYDDPNHDSDQWIYLSAMGKVRRIVSGSEDEPKTGSLFGSEISYEDVEARHLEDYTYTLLKTVTYKNRPCWVIESKPTPAHARKSSYSKAVQWIDRERYLSLKINLYDRQGRPLKRLTTKGIEQVEGIWITRQMTVNNLQTKRISAMKIEALAVNPPVDDDFLTQRALTDGAFRESRLKKLRKMMD